jgi:hypothetical protein
VKPLGDDFRTAFPFGKQGAKIVADEPLNLNNMPAGSYVKRPAS